MRYYEILCQTNRAPHRMRVQGLMVSFGPCRHICLESTRFDQSRDSGSEAWCVFLGNDDPTDDTAGQVAVTIS